MSVWIVLASGPSMCREDAEAVRGRGTVVAINRTFELAPWADILYSCDPSWWWHSWQKLQHFTGRRVTRWHERSTPPEGVEIKAAEEGDGLGLAGIRSGNNSGYQALNLAYLEGAKTVIVLGLDMQHTDGRRHWHPDHPRPLGNFGPGMVDLCRPKFTQLASDLKRHGVTVVNASRETSLKCFPRMPLAAALDRFAPNPAQPVALPASRGFTTPT